MRYAATPSALGPARSATINAIRERKDFECPSLHGSAGSYLPRNNRLPYVWEQDFRADQREGRIIYVVYSWQTPIAWCVERPDTPHLEWVMPRIGYTSYTTRHQALVDRAIREFDPRRDPRREHLLIGIDWNWEVPA